MSVKKKKASTQEIIRDKNKPETAAAAVNGAAGIVREETLVWIFTIVCSLLVYFFAGNIISNVYKPDLGALFKIAEKIVIQPGGVHPEPVESMLAQAGVVVIGLCLLVFYWLFSKMAAIRNLAAQPIFHIITGTAAIVIAALIYVDFSAQNPFFVDKPGEFPQNARDLVAKSNFDFYFDGVFLGNYALLYTVILFPLVAGLFLLGIKKYHWDERKLFKPAVNYTGYILSGSIVLAIVLMNTFYFPYTFENKYDFSAVFYSMTQVYAGTPLLTDGFTNTYGMYPQFLNLVFQLIGLSIFKFSLVMSLLIALSFAFNFYVLNKFTNNRVLLFLGFFTVVFFPYLDSKLVQSFDPYFAIFPIRYVIPCTLAFLATLYLQKKSQIIYWTTSVVQAFFILWNPEIGIVSYVAWLAFNTYLDFYTEEGKFGLKKILLHWVAGVGIIVLVFFIYRGLVYLAYGSAPELSLLFGPILVFGKIGFFLLPMSLVHPWNLMVLVLILGFVHSISKLYKKEITPKAAVIFLVSVIGLGFFFYFQGRSHNWSFSAITGFSIILLTLLGDELWGKIKNANLLSLDLLFVVFLFVVSFSVFEILFDAGSINELVYQENDKEKQADEQNRIESNAAYIQKNTAEKESVFVLTGLQYQDLYFEGSKRKAGFNPGLIDMFALTDLDRMQKKISDSSFKFFIEPGLCAFQYLLKPIAAMAATYELKDSNKALKMLYKRKDRTLAKSYLVHADNLIHRKYNDDTSGINMRVRDALGMEQVLLNPGFSVEVIFKPHAQIYQYATLAGNMNDTSGFVMCNIVNTNIYFFGINGHGFTVPMPANGWVYCVMNVFPDRVEVYQNGNLGGTLPLPAPIKQSPALLSIGNGGGFRFYAGVISEVAINKAPLDKAQVQATLEEIKKM
jgi:hypothetical protein